MPYKDPQKQKESDRKRNKLFRKRNPDYYKNWREKNPDYFKEYFNVYNTNPENIFKNASRKWLNHNIRKGKIKRLLNCENCKREIKTEGHHPDYNKPLEVIWVCKNCHEKIHHK